MNVKDNKFSISEIIFGMFLIIFGLSFAFMMIFEGTIFKDLYESNEAQTTISIVKEIFKLLFSNIFEGIIERDKSPTSGIIGLVIFSIINLILIFLGILWALFMFATFIVFPLFVLFIFFMSFVKWANKNKESKKDTKIKNL